MKKKKLIKMNDALKARIIDYEIELYDLVTKNNTLNNHINEYKGVINFWKKRAVVNEPQMQDFVDYAFDLGQEELFFNLKYQQ